MKYKVGDRVRIKSKEWWDAQPKNESGSIDCGADTFNGRMASMCGKVVEISDVEENTYFIKEFGCNWTDEMFEGLVSGEKTLISTELIKDIAEVIKTHNLGVSISENNGKMIVEPLKVEEEKDLLVDTPVMCKDKPSACWTLRYYAYKGRVFVNGNKFDCEDKTTKFDYTIPCSQFNFENPEESLKYNIVK